MSFRSFSKCNLFCSTAALTFFLLPSAAHAQNSYNAGDPTVVSGSVTFDRTSTLNTEIYTIASDTAVLDFIPTDTGPGGPIDFQIAGTTAVYENAIGLADFTVLNRITPVDTSRPVQFNGTVISQLQDGLGAVAPGGSVWFYSPGGVIIGANSVFDVGNLLLSAGDPTGGTGVISDPNQFTIQSVPDANAAVNIQAGGQITAANPGSYIALVAPAVIQSGTVSTNGSAAYVAAERATLTFNSGLFDIQALGVGAGTQANNNVPLVHDGTTRFIDDAGPRRAYLVAVPKNDAITLLISGGSQLGFDTATGVNIDNGVVVLSGNREVNDTVIGAFGEALETNIVIQGGPINADVVAGTGGSLTSSVSVIADGLDIDFAGDVDLATDAVTGAGGPGGVFLTTQNGGAITIVDNLSAQAAISGSRDQDVTGGVVSVDLLGGDILIGGDANLVSAASNAGPGTDPAGSVLGGAISVAAGDSNLSVGGSLITISEVTGADQSGIQTTAGDATGGLVQLNTGAGTVNVTGDLQLISTGRGGNTLSNGVLGGVGTGGTINIATGTGSINATSASILAEGYGGFSIGAGADGSGGNAVGGTITVSAPAVGGTLSFDNADYLVNAFGGDVAGTGRNAGGATAGDIDIVIQGGDYNFNGSLTARATGTAGLGADGSAAGAQGGTIDVQAAGGNITGSGNVFLAADAATAPAVVASFDGGDAIGGSVILSAVNNGTISITNGPTGSVGLNADGEAGTNSGAGDMTGGNGTAGNAQIVATGNGLITVDGGQISFSSNGIGGNGVVAGTAGGDGRGGTASVSQGTGGQVTITNAGTFISASGFGGRNLGGGTGIGGIGIGGDGRFVSNDGTVETTGQVRIMARGFGGDSNGGIAGGDGFGGLANIGADVGLTQILGDATLFADGVGGDVNTGPGVGGNGTGGSAIIGTISTGAINVGGLVSADASASGGRGLGADGGGAVGGFADLFATGGTITIGGAATMSGSADGGTSDGGAGSVAGNGTAGNARIFAAGGLIDVGQGITLNAVGTGGDSLTIGTLGGTGAGGNAFAILNSGGQIRSVNSLQSNAAGRGGANTSGDISDSGDGLGGSVNILISGSSVLDTSNISAIADGSGGSLGTGSGTAGAGTGGSVVIGISDDGVANVGGMGIRAEGIGGDTRNATVAIGGAGAGGLIDISINTNGTISSTGGFGINALGRSSGGAGLGNNSGAATGGMVTLNIASGGSASFDSTGQLGAGAFTPTGASGSVAPVTGGQVDITVDAGSLALQNSFLISTDARDSFSNLALFDGGDAVGGPIALSVTNAGTVTVGGISLNAQGIAGDSNGADDGIAGNATGGDAQLTVSGNSQLRVNGSAQIFTAGVAGNGLLAGTAGGAGTAGNITIDQQSGGRIAIIGDGRITAQGIGGSNRGGGSGIGGTGTGGDISLSSDNGEISTTGFLQVTSSGSGGSSDGGIAGGIGLSGDITVLLQNSPVDGGLITGGSLSIFANGGGGSAVSGVADGGDGQAGIVRLQIENGGIASIGSGFVGSTASGGAGFGAGATSGTGNGGTAEVLVGPGTIDSTAGLILDASGRGQNGGTANGGTAQIVGSGGILNAAAGASVRADARNSGPGTVNGTNSTGGTAIVSATAGALSFGTLSVSARGTGGEGAVTGGLGTGGTAQLLAQGGDITLGNGTISAEAFNGYGGSGPLQAAQGGNASVQANGNTITITGDLTVSATGRGDPVQFMPPPLDGSDGVGGNAVISAFNGGIIDGTGNADLRAEGLGGDSRGGDMTGGAGTGGDARIVATATGRISFGGNVMVDSGSEGGDGFVDGATGGASTGGTASISQGSGGFVTIGGDATVNADARGGRFRNADGGANGTGGDARLVSNDGTVNVDGDARVSASGQSGGTTGTSRGGLANIGADTGLTSIGGFGSVSAGAFGGSGGLLGANTGGGSGFAGSALIGTIGTGAITIGRFASANATGQGSFSTGTGRGGDGTGGLAQIFADTGSVTTGGARATADGRGGGVNEIGGTGGNGMAGNASILAQNNGVLTINGDARGDSIGRGGGNFQAGNAGGDGMGGVASLTQNSGGTISVAGDARLDTSAFGQRNTGGGSGIGGTGAAGTSVIAANDAQISVTGDVQLESRGQGGESDGGVASGAGTGGLTNFTAISGQIIIDGAVSLNAGGTGGAVLNTPADGGNGTGGNAFLSTTGPGNIQIAGTTNITAEGRGANGLDTGVGGDGLSGLAQVLAITGDTMLNGALTISVSGRGGLGDVAGDGTGGRTVLFTNSGGTLAVNANSLLFADGIGGNGISSGGTGVGGTVSVASADGLIDLGGGSFQARADGNGGFVTEVFGSMGEILRGGGSGGSGVGGAVFLNAGAQSSTDQSDGRTIFGNVVAITSARGRDGGDGAPGQDGGRGGDAIAGVLGIAALDAVGTLTTGNLTPTNSAIAGRGGNGGLADALGNGGNGGDGGTAVGRQIGISHFNVPTLTVRNGSNSFGDILATVFATGGNGGNALVAGSIGGTGGSVTVGAPALGSNDAGVAVAARGVPTTTGDVRISIGTRGGDGGIDRSGARSAGGSTEAFVGLVASAEAISGPGRGDFTGGDVTISSTATGGLGVNDVRAPAENGVAFAAVRNGDLIIQQLTLNDNGTVSHPDPIDAAGEVRFTGIAASFGTLEVLGSTDIRSFGNIGLFAFDNGEFYTSDLILNNRFSIDGIFGPQTVLFGDPDNPGTIAGEINVDNSINANIAGDVLIDDGIFAGGDLTISTSGAIQTATIDAAGNIRLFAGTDLSVGALTSLTDIFLSAPFGNATIGGLVSAPSIRLRSSDINIVSGGGLGDINTQTLDVFARIPDQPIILGGDGSGGGYNLSSQEFSTFRAQTITVSADQINGALPADITVRDFTLQGSLAGASANLLASDLNIFSPGSIRIEGAALIANAGATDRLTFDAASRIEVVTDIGGSIRIEDDMGNLSGALNLDATNIAVATDSLLGQLAVDPRFAGRDDLVNAPDGSDLPQGFVEAQAVELVGGDTIIIQNSNTDELRAGFSAGTGGLTLSNLGGTSSGLPVDVVINGRIDDGAGGFLTNADTRGAVMFEQGQSANDFSTEALINGCLLGGGACDAFGDGPIIPDEPDESMDETIASDILQIAEETSTEEPVEELEDEEEKSAEVTPEDVGKKSPIARSVPVVSTRKLNSSPIIEEPVTGSGNPNLIGGPTDGSQGAAENASGEGL